MVISMMYFWLMIIIILVIIEALTINLTTIWFIASAILALIISCLIDSFALEFAVFVIGGLILLLTTKDYLQRFLNKTEVKTNIDRIIGMQGVITKEVTKTKLGEVKVDGKYWSCTADKKIPVDSIVLILEINGTKLKVKEMEE